MKKLVIILLLILIAAGFYRYVLRGTQSLKNAGDKKTVLTSFTVIADMAKNVAGDNLTVESLTKVGAEIHGYEPTPQDLIRAQNADLILDNGLNLEKWAEKLYANIPDVPHVTLTEGITPIGIAEGPYKNKPNPHAWMSPSNALIYVDNIKKSFIEIDPQNAGVYEQNAENYKSKIRELDALLKTELALLPGNKRFLVSCEGAFTYLIRDYDLKELYLWPINADAQGTPQQVKRVVEEVKRNAIPVVFCESTVNNKAQMQVASETGAKFGDVFYVDSLSDLSGPTPTYLDLLRYNSQILINGLTNENSRN